MDRCAISRPCFITGNLHFANIEVEDGRSDRRSLYTCISQNEFIRGLTQGEVQRIIPKQEQGSCLLSKADCPLACCDREIGHACLSARIRVGCRQICLIVNCAFLHPGHAEILHLLLLS